MKKLIYTVVYLLFTVSLVNAQWVQMSNGLGTGRTVQSFAVIGDNIFVGIAFYSGVNGGVYLSTNDGNSWTSAGLTDQFYIPALEVSGTNLFAGTFFGVFLSTNNGTNWTQTPLNNKFVRSIAINGNIILAGTDSSIYRSTNDGASWIQTALINHSVNVIKVIGDRIFAGTDNYSPSGGVFVSTNNGLNWSQTSLINKDVRSFAAIGSNIFAGTAGNVYLSTNYGTSWNQTNLNNKDVFALATFSNNLFAGTSQSVYLSTNYGTNWIQKNQGLNQNTNVDEILINNNYIFAGIYLQSIWRRSFAEIIGVQNISKEIPSGFSLSQNYPNPFNPTTSIRYDIPKNSFVKLVVYDILGKKIETLVNEKQTAGTYEATFKGESLTSGVYFYRLTTEDYSDTKQMILLK